MTIDTIGGGRYGAAAMFAAARDVLAAAAAARAFPGAVIEVGRASGPRWQEPFGRLTYDAAAPPTRLDSIFDLASLTKVVSTASLVMRHLASGRLSLDTRVADLQAQWRGADREAVTIRHLLDHSSGLPAHARLWEQAAGREPFEAAISRMPLERPPGTQSIYSDLGFIVLGFVLEDIGGQPLADQFASIARELGEIGFSPGPAEVRRTAPTEDDPWRGRVLRGEVHDENAYALGGAAGHAGLFGTAMSVGAFARSVLATFHRRTWLGEPALMRTFAARSDVPGSSRALAWDTMRPTSSCGTMMSPTAIGHTGFTGTSLWIDSERDVYVVLLTNRVHPTRANEALVALRPQVHDAVMRDVVNGEW